MNHERAPNGNKYDYLFDGLGSVVGMTDSNGNEVNRYNYDPYGVMLNQQEQTGFTNLFKFAGGQYRSSTGLYKFGERYYDPTLGRWTQLDSAGTGYTYANDNPVNEVDPSGQDLSVACFVGMIIGLVTGGLVGLILAIWFPPAWVPIIIGLLVGALIGCIVDVLNLDSLLQQWIISHRLQR